MRSRSTKRRQADRLLQVGRAARIELTGGLCEGATPASPTFEHPGFHVHHVILRSQQGRHDVDNLRVLCVAGHDWVHRNIAEARARGLLA